MTGRFVRTLAGGLAALIVSAGVARAQAPVLTTEVNGNAVTFNWTSTAGATGYRIDAGLASGVYNLGSQALGAVNTIGVPGVPNGVYFIRVVALPGEEPSNEVRLQLPAPPAAPTNLQVVRNGTAIVATWDAGAGGGPLSAYQLRVGLSPGGTDFPINTVANSFAAGPVPPNTYYFRVVALNAAGVSSDSNEVPVFMPAAGACDAPPAVSFNQFVFSSYISLAWTPVPTAVNYLASVKFNGVGLVTDQSLGQMTRTRGTVPLGTWEVTIKAQFGCGSTGAPASTTLLVNGAPPPGPRTPDPAPGTLLPMPGYGRTVVNSLAAARPDLVNASCRETGGNNRFVFEVVKELRKRDNRWGLNWKRGNLGDMSQDIVSYNRSALPDEGASTGPSSSNYNINIVDMIGGHCGPRPGANWEDVTNLTVERGARAVWTLLPYIEAGYTP